MAKFIGKHTIYEDRGDGSAYMTRYWIGRLRLHIFHRGDLDELCHNHPWDFWTFPLTPYVEMVLDPRIVAGALDPHSDGFIGEPSRKSYRRELVRAFRFTFRKASHSHRVLGRWSGWSHTRTGGTYRGFEEGREHSPIADPRKRIITIVWRGRAEHPWGFFVNVANVWKFMPWRKA